MAKQIKPSSGGNKQVSSSSKIGGSAKPPNPLFTLANGSGKKDYAKKPKSGATDLGIPSFGMTGMTGED